MMTANSGAAEISVPEQSDEEKMYEILDDIEQEIEEKYSHCYSNGASITVPVLQLDRSGVIISFTKEPIMTLRDAVSKTHIIVAPFMKTSGLVRVLRLLHAIDAIELPRDVEYSLITVDTIQVGNTPVGGMQQANAPVPAPAKLRELIEFADKCGLVAVDLASEEHSIVSAPLVRSAATDPTSLSLNQISLAQPYLVSRIKEPRLLAIAHVLCALDDLTTRELGGETGWNELTQHLVAPNNHSDAIGDRNAALSQALHYMSGGTMEFDFSLLADIEHVHETYKVFEKCGYELVFQRFLGLRYFESLRFPEELLCRDSDIVELRKQLSDAMAVRDVWRSALANIGITLREAIAQEEALSEHLPSDAQTDDNDVERRIHDGGAGRDDTSRGGLILSEIAYKFGISSMLELYKSGVPLEDVVR